VTQSVRVDRAMIRYFVAGASSQPPSTATAAGVVLGAANGATSLPNGNGSQPGTKPGGTLPSGGTGGTGGSGTGSGTTAPRATAGFAVVPAAVAEWISSHRSELPEPPFEMVASVTVSGVTSAGNRIETNELPLSIIVTEDNVF